MVAEDEVDEVFEDAASLLPEDLDESFDFESLGVFEVEEESVLDGVELALSDGFDRLEVERDPESFL